MKQIRFLSFIFISSLVLTVSTHAKPNKQMDPLIQEIYQKSNDFEKQCKKDNQDFNKQLKSQKLSRRDELLKINEFKTKMMGKRLSFLKEQRARIEKLPVPSTK